MFLSSTPAGIGVERSRRTGLSPGPQQYLAKIGQKPKFLRPGGKMQKVIDEISSDASLYSAMSNDCAGIT
jgi:hypothetical protein